MKKNSNLSHKLAAYSAMALAGIASVGTANAQIVYTDCPDETFTFGTDTTFSLDLNADAVVDYGLNCQQFTSSGFNGQFALLPAVTGNMQLVTGQGWQTWNWYGAALNLNDPINSAGSWACPGGVNSLSRVFFATSFSSTLYGNFADGVDHYEGVYFDISGSLHYGWIRVNVTIDATAHTGTLILKDYAYNTVADQQILAGQMTVGVAENEMNVGIFAADRKLNVNTNVNGTLNVLNAVGQNVVSQQITENTVIDMNGFSAGIYTVQFESNGKFVTKKVSL